MPDNRRFTRFSLRLLLVAVTLVAVGLGIFTHRARQQEAVVDELRELKVRVAYDYQVTQQADGSYTKNYYSPPSESWAPAPLLNLCGEDFFHSAVYVSLTAAHKEDVLPLLMRLPNLRHVWFPWNGPHDDQPLKIMQEALPHVAFEIYPAIVG